jgi:UDP-glucose 4-epimerase
MLKNSRVLVTGGAGFVGSNIVAQLLEQGAIVTVLDNLYTGFERLIPQHSNVTFTKGDVCDKDVVDALVKDHKLIIHAAAKNIIVSTKNPFDDYETNIGGTLNMLIAARKYGIERFVYTGSASVYGNPNVLPIPENSSVYTLSPYAVSKLAGENYCTAFYESYNLPTAVVRYSNVYGVNQDPANPYCGVISKFFDSAMRNENIRIHGDGEQTRDFTYVSDTASATIEALVNPRATGQIFNTGSGFEVSINSLALKIIQITGSSSALEHIDKRDIDNIRRRVVNIEQIRRILRWSPKYTLDAGLKATYEWLRHNK